MFFNFATDDGVLLAAVRMATYCHRHRQLLWPMAAALQYGGRTSIVHMSATIQFLAEPGRLGRLAWAII